MAATHSKNMLLLAWLGPVTVAGSLGTPVLTIGEPLPPRHATMYSATIDFWEAVLCMLVQFMPFGVHSSIRWAYLVVCEGSTTTQHCADMLVLLAAACAGLHNGCGMEGLL